MRAGDHRSLRRWRVLRPQSGPPKLMLLIYSGLFSETGGKGDMSYDDTNRLDEPIDRLAARALAARAAQSPQRR